MENPGFIYKGKHLYFGIKEDIITLYDFTNIKIEKLDCSEKELMTIELKELLFSLKENNDDEEKYKITSRIIDIDRVVIDEIYLNTIRNQMLNYVK